MERKLAERSEEKSEVEVASVLVERRIFVKMFPPVKVLLSVRSVVDAPVPPPVIQTPFTAKHPPVILNPFPKVEVELPMTAKLVEVAFVVVLRERFGRKSSVANVSVALIRASVRALVKYRLVPSATLVVKRPRDEVASCWYAPPAYEPRRIPAAVGLLIPVPPPPAARRPASELVKVMVLPAPVMVVDAVKPWYEEEEVAKVMVGPACV